MNIILKIRSIRKRASDRLLMIMAKSAFKSIGNGCVFHPSNSSLDYHHISLGDEVLIGHGARFWATESAITIGSHVTFAPSVSIIAGNHRFDIPGKWITQYQVKDKRPVDDLPVVIENDVWVGTNVTILNGVHIGRGAIVAAGAVVNKEVPPYSIVGGVPAKVIGVRFSKEEIVEHERMLYAESERLSAVQLQHITKYR